MVKQGKIGRLGLSILMIVWVFAGNSPIIKGSSQSPTVVDHLVISEIAPASTQSASDEFIEIYNPTDAGILVDGLRLEYKSATGTSWTLKATLSGVIEPRGFYLAGTNAYSAIANTTLSSGLASSGGHVRIFQSASESGPEQTIDLLGWGDANSAEGLAPTPAPASAQSLKRRFSDDGQIIDSDNNLADFMLSSSPDPQSTPSVTPPPEQDPDPEPTPVVYLPISISELLPDPAAPASDDTDEFIELYNPNLVPVDLAGYVLKTGSNLQYSWVLSAGTLEPNNYATYYSGQTHLVLSNSGSTVQLFDPSATPASDLVTYTTAKTGQAWALIDDSWQWTSQLTPGDVNQASVDDNGSVLGATSDGTTQNGDYPKLKINELLIDPASPKTDTDDEFIELYNPSNATINLNGYILLSGSHLATKAILPSVSLIAYGYAVFYSRDLNISLPNTGASVELLDPAKKILDQVTFQKATTNAAWALSNGTWQWTTTLTPGAKNIITAITKKAKAKTTGSKTSGAKDQSGDGVADPATIPTSPYSTLLVAGVVVAALLYGLYEFRYDIRNKIHLIRRYFGSRQKTGS